VVVSIFSIGRGATCASSSGGCTPLGDAGGWWAAALSGTVLGALGLLGAGVAALAFWVEDWTRVDWAESLVCAAVVAAGNFVSTSTGAGLLSAGVDEGVTVCGAGCCATGGATRVLSCDAVAGIAVAGAA
jgi:hypothetical protein